MLPDITAWTDDYLLKSKNDYDKMLDFAMTQRASPKFIERMNNQNIPSFNPVFTDMKAKIEAEISRRGLTV